MSVYKKLLVSLLLFAGLYVGRWLYMTPSFHTGEKAPDFQANLINGEAFRLSQLQGNYVLVHFWGSWCGPCRIENPGLRQLWLKYRDTKLDNGKRFFFVSIAVETNKNSAIRVIQQDKLLWEHHVIDLGDSLRFFDSPISNLWGVNQVPMNFLLDPNGNIIRRDISNEDLDTFLQQKR